jgi:hypothetical protein
MASCAVNFIEVERWQAAVLRDRSPHTATVRIEMAAATAESRYIPSGWMHLVLVASHHVVMDTRPMAVDAGETCSEMYVLLVEPASTAVAVEVPDGMAPKTGFISCIGE